MTDTLLRFHYSVACVAAERRRERAERGEKAALRTKGAGADNGADKSAEKEAEPPGKKKASKDAKTKKKKNKNKRDKY